MRRTKWRLFVLISILVLYVSLAVYYAVTVPMFEAPEEVAHFFYAKYLVDARALPVQNPQTPSLWHETGSQPPLYYALVAAVIASVDTRRATDYLWRNPYVNMGLPEVPGNKNFYVHTLREQWPYRDVPLAVHLARGVSILLGILAIIGTYTLASTLFPGRWEIPLVAAATQAFLPQFLFVTSTVTGDALALCTGTLALWYMARALRQGAGYGQVAMLGLVVGLVALSKVGGVLFLVPGGAVAWMTARGRREQAILRTGVFLLVFAVVAGWWYVRNTILYGDPLGVGRLLQYARYPLPEMTVESLVRELKWFLQSFWALFGWYNVPIGGRAYLLLHVVSGVAVGGLLLWIVRRQYRENARVWGLLVVALVLAAVPAFVARGLGFVPLAQARHAFPALAVVMLLLVIGWTQVVPGRVRPYWAALLPLGLLALAVVVPGRWIAPAYAWPQRISPEAIPARARAVDLVFDGRIRVWAVDIPQITTYVGDTIDVTLYMSKVGPLPVDYTLRIRLLGREQEEVGRLETMTGWGTYPTRLWQDGEVIADHYRVRVAPGARVPTLLRVEISFVNHWNGRVLPATTGQGVPVTARIGTLRLVARDAPPPKPQVPLRATFAGEIALVGIDPPPARVRRGEQMTFRLYWQALRPARASYTIFTHLVREGDPHPVAQHDKLPLDGDYPTVAWAPGEIVRDTYQIRVPETIPPGTYAVVTGVYQLQTLQRLTLNEGPTRAWLSNAALVAIVEVE